MIVVTNIIVELVLRRPAKSLDEENVKGIFFGGGERWEAVFRFSILWTIEDGQVKLI